MYVVGGGGGDGGGGRGREAGEKVQRALILCLVQLVSEFFIFFSWHQFFVYFTHI